MIRCTKWFWGHFWDLIWSFPQIWGLFQERLPQWAGRGETEQRFCVVGGHLHEWGTWWAGWGGPTTTVHSLPHVSIANEEKPEVEVNVTSAGREIFVGWVEKNKTDWRPEGGFICSGGCTASRRAPPIQHLAKIQLQSQAGWAPGMDRFLEHWCKGEGWCLCCYWMVERAEG